MFKTFIKSVKFFTKYGRFPSAMDKEAISVFKEASAIVAEEDARNERIKKEVRLTPERREEIIQQVANRHLSPTEDISGLMFDKI